MEIKGTTAIVTGGASGLGGATAKRLASAGAQVFALDLERSIAKAEEVDGVAYVEADVTDAEQVQAAVDRAAESGSPLRIVVNCAGVGRVGRILGRNGPHDLELFRTVIMVNLLGTFNVTRLAAEAINRTDPLADDQRGIIVNTASVAALDRKSVV